MSESYDSQSSTVGELMEARETEFGFAEPPDGERWLAMVNGILREVECLGPNGWVMLQPLLGKRFLKEPSMVRSVPFNLITVLTPAAA